MAASNSNNILQLLKFIMDKSWTVVKFIDEDSVEAVPTTWIQGNSCFWPPLTQQKVVTAIKNHEVANTCWPSYEITFFKNGTFGKFFFLLFY